MRCSVFFFFNDTATTEIYTLSLHDALPICPTSIRKQTAPTTPKALSSLTSCREAPTRREIVTTERTTTSLGGGRAVDRKSTRLNSSHANISYAVFCLKKKKKSR